MNEKKSSPLRKKSNVFLFPFPQIDVWFVLWRGRRREDPKIYVNACGAGEGGEEEGVS